MQLQQRISSLENGIADRRELYNEAVNLNNVRIEQFPTLSSPALSVSTRSRCSNSRKPKRPTSTSSNCSVKPSCWSAAPGVRAVHHLGRPAARAGDRHQKRNPHRLARLSARLLAVIGLIAWTSTFRRRRAITDTPTSRIASAAQGYVELSGQGRALDDPPLYAPLTQAPACGTASRSRNGPGRTNGRPSTAAKATCPSSSRTAAAVA